MTKISDRFDPTKCEHNDDMVKRLGRVGSFAPGNYMCKCVGCGVTFSGDKRALHCLPCAVFAIIAAGGEGDKEAVAWRVKDFADGWILCHSEAQAKREAEGAGNLVQALGVIASRDHHTDHCGSQPDLAVGGTAALAWLAKNDNCELSHGYEREEDDGCWRVHRVNGGVNDREWTLIGSGETPEAAIGNAMKGGK